MSILSYFWELQARLLYIRRPLLLVLVGFLTAPLALAQDQPAYEPHVVVVQFEPGIVIGQGAAKAGLQIFDSMAARYGVHTIKRVFPFLDHVQPTPETARNLAALRRTYYVRYSADDDPRDVAKALMDVLGVTYTEPVGIIRYHGTGAAIAEPDDALFGDQTYLRHMRLPEAWEIVKGEDGNPPVVIAIVDQGGNWRHEDMLANVWTNPDEIPDNRIDDDENGFIDDVHGVNFYNGDDADNDPYSPGGFHGTAVAGAAGVVTDNGTGLASPAWNARLMHIAGAFDGVLYAAANGADIVNTSWVTMQEGSRRMPDQVLDLATDMGALVVASAGNNGRLIDGLAHNPRAHPRVLSVGATEKNSLAKAGFSSYGKTVSVFAPGRDINTTTHGGGYTRASGTSFSASLVSGVAALVKTRFPDLSPDELREQVRLASENMDAQNPAHAGRLGRGYVNAEAALQAPAYPAVRVRRWSWSNADGDSRINSGDEVTISAEIVNYLEDARMLTVELVTDSYPFIEITRAEANVGFLERGDSTNVTFRFAVASDAPENRTVRFHTRVRDGTFTDEPDMFYLDINRRVDIVHEALSALYVSTGGDNWHTNSGWDIARTLAPSEWRNWFGIRTTRGWVTSLVLDDNNLAGSIPPELGNLPRLQGLYLFYNSLTGTIPVELGNLSQLQYLNLCNNFLAGPIPPELGNLSQLQHLNLCNNFLAGPIPPELGNLAQLQRLYLFDNSLTGTIPVELGNLSRLQHLNLSDNAFTGRLPRSLMQLTNLQELRFGGQDLCAPADDTFQAWLGSIPRTSGPTCAGTVEVEDETLPQAFALRGNYPNPFNPSTRVAFDLPSAAEVTVHVFDVLGRNVLVTAPVSLPGDWDHSLEVNASSLSSGVYFYQVKAQTGSNLLVRSGRMILSK